MDFFLNLVQSVGEPLLNTVTTVITQEGEVLEDQRATTERLMEEHGLDVV